MANHEFESSQLSQLQIPAEAYFCGVAHRVFDEYFTERSAIPVPNNRSDLVRYQSPNWFAEVFYLPLDGPRYAPRVAVGVVPERFSDPRRNRIDVLHTVPIGDELRRYNFEWEYSCELEAIAAFLKVRDRIIAVHTEPFFSDTARLSSLLEERAAELDRAWDDEIRRHNETVARQAAEVAFGQRDYDAVIRHLTGIAAEFLSPSDIRKLAIARKRQ